MRTRVVWDGDARFVGTTERGHEVLMDGPPDAGGQDQGPRPMEMLLLGFGGCSSFDVVHILRRSRRPVAGCEVEIEAERATSDPKVFTRIHLHFIVICPDTPLAVVERAVTLSAEKYCSAARMMAATAEISHSVEMRDEGDR